MVLSLGNFPMTVEDGEDVPPPMTNAERSRKFRRNSPKCAAASKTKYRHDNSKWETDAHYLSRTLVVWDGEGITTAGGDHIYVMFAAMASDDMKYHSIVEPTGIGTAQIFEFLLKTNAKRPGALNVIYGGSYDFNMFLRDIPRRDLRKIYDNVFHVWQGYRISWRRGKSFYVKRIEGDLPGVTIFDTVSFFQQPFVAACDAYLGARFVERDLIVRNKALRSSFTMGDVPEVTRYNSAELTNLVLLITELRARLNKVGLRPRRWDGPGAVAAALLMREDVKSAMAVCPAPVAEAARYAYAGGRFEVVRFGHVEEPAYEYDVNSAYPAALRNVPNLARGEWVHESANEYRKEFALYHVRFKAYHMDYPGPLFRRDANGTICYPLSSVGWYWGPEIVSLIQYTNGGWGEFEILESWQFVEDDPTDRPFAFIEPLYNKRRALKCAGDGAHVGIKLALNSLYGKLAQQVGWKRTEDGVKTPPFHQIEWAGYTTSWCRAQVLIAAMKDLPSVIAFETDAVFMSKEIDVIVGSNLGDFERVDFADLTYVQSGLYFGTQVDGTIVSKTRGVDRGTLTREMVLEKMSEPKAADREVAAPLTRFVGIGVALMQGMSKWRRWEVMVKHLSLEPGGKRMHLECDYDEPGNPIAFGHWHYTMCPLLNHTHSKEFPIEWLNPNPEMSMLENLRGEVNEYDD